MMKENIKYTLLKHILNEGRLEDTIAKYVGTLPEGVVRELSQNDPSGNNKYLDWMVKTVIQVPNEKADIITKIKCFHDNNARLTENHINAVYTPMETQRGSTEEHKAVIAKIKKAPKDINSYPSHHWLKPLCEYFEEQKPKTASRVKLYEDDKWLVVAPLTHQASCSYGAHSTWCVSTSNSSYFSQYMGNGILVFFIDKKGSHSTKTSANVYKFAVHINFDNPSPDRWNWYSMDDTPTDARLMMNLVPQSLMNVAKKYLDDVLKELGKQSSVDEKELNDKSLAWYRTGNRYIIFLDYTNYTWTNINTAADWLMKFNTNRPVDLSRYKDSGYPFVTLDIRAGRLPSLNTSYLAWNPVLNLRQPDNTVLRSALFAPNQGFNGNYNNIGSNLNNLPEDKRGLVYENYINLFNKSEFVKTLRIRTNELQVGDVIIFRPHGRTYGRGENLSVVRVAEKSLVLSNGSRIARSASSTKEKVTGAVKIVDDSIRTESRWIRTRII